jgi:hypothetical protein
MALCDLSQFEREIVGQCIRALVDGPFLPDWEFHTLTGLFRPQIAEVAERWSSVDEAIDLHRRAIHASLATLLYGPIRQFDRWHEYIAADRAEIERIARKWWRESPPASYVDHLRRLIRVDERVEVSTDRSDL